MKITADISSFQAALREVQKATKKDEVDIVNSALKDVAFRSASFTKKATINFDTATLARLASTRLKERQGRYTKAQHRDEMRAIVRKRRAGIGAIRAGWIPAIQALGGKYRGAKLRPGGSAARGSVQRATIARLSGVITNAIRTKNFGGKEFGGGDIDLAHNALIRAVSFVTADKIAYAKRKIRATLKRFSK